MIGRPLRVLDTQNTFHSKMTVHQTSGYIDTHFYFLMQAIHLTVSTKRILHIAQDSLHYIKRLKKIR